MSTYKVGDLVILIPKFGSKYCIILDVDQNDPYDIYYGMVQGKTEPMWIAEISIERKIDE